MSEADSVAELARKGAQLPQILTTDDGREFLILPEGMSQYPIADEYGLKRSMPAYLEQAVMLQTVDSLVDYVERFKIEETMLFADIEKSRILSVLDYHSASVSAADGLPVENYPPKVQRARHRAGLALPYSEEWKTWTKIDEKYMKQLDFARFVEENAADIAAPSGADLLEIVRDLQAIRKATFIQAVRTNSDAENFEYKVESDAVARGVEIPSAFALEIPVYFGEPNSGLRAQLRWNIDDGALTLGVKLLRLENVRQAVFKQIVLAVADRTKCPVVFGSIEKAVAALSCSY